MSDKPRIGVSACLLGQPVRWDAGHKRDAYLVDVFGRHVEWVPVCPEVEAGFPTPRETMHLVRTNGHGITALGRLVAGGRSVPKEELADQYESGFMRALTVVATPKRHANVLQHMLGYFKTSIDADRRAELLTIIDDCRLGRLPLIVPITLMKHPSVARVSPTSRDRSTWIRTRAS